MLFQSRATSFESIWAVDRFGETPCWVKDMNVLIEDGNIKGYKVNLAITFLLEDGGAS